LSEVYGGTADGFTPPVLPGFFETPRGKRFAWYLYDFGNSAYAAVVILAIYSAYFKEAVVGGAEGTLLWGVAVAIAMVVSAVISPVLGAIADHRASRKKMLAFFTAICCVFTGLLFFVHKGDVLMGMGFFILAEIGYRASQVFYNGLLPSISTQQTVGRISGNGWAIGSLGGIVCLLIVLSLVVQIGGNFVLRSTMVLTAVFFAIATLPLFLHVREPGVVKELPDGKSLLTVGFSQIAKTLRNARQFKQYMKFLLAFVLFNDGVMITLNFAAIIGGVLHGFEREQMIILIILVQSTNVIGAWVFGLLADRVSAKQALLQSVALMIATIFWMMENTSDTAFYIIGALAGFAMAGLQSVSRTMVAKLCPAEKAAEFFGLFAVAGRSSSFIGPAIFGWVAADIAARYMSQSTSALEAEQIGLRMASFIIIGFLVIGGAILFLVDEKRGMEAAGTSEK
jgi:UMF1 family MFS transporter